MKLSTVLEPVVTIEVPLVAETEPEDVVAGVQFELPLTTLATNNVSPPFKK